MVKKLIFYDRFGVEECNWVSPLLGVRFEFSAGELQLYFPDGTPFFSFWEVGEQLAQAKWQNNERRR